MPNMLGEQAFLMFQEFTSSQDANGFNVSIILAINGSRQVMPFASHSVVTGTTTLVYEEFLASRPIALESVAVMDSQMILKLLIEAARKAPANWARRARPAPRLKYHRTTLNTVRFFHVSPNA